MHRRRVRAGPGCTQGDVDHTTHIYGLAVPTGIVSTTGIAGLTLGGGTGYLTRKHGLTIDNLLETDVCRIVTALRRGGGSASSRASCSELMQSTWSKPVQSSGISKMPGPSCRSTGISCLARPRNSGPCRPEDCSTGGPVPGRASGQARLRHRRLLPLMAKLLDELPAPLFNWMGEIPYPALQSMFDPFFPKGLQWYWRFRERADRRSN